MAQRTKLPHHNHRPFNPDEKISEAMVEEIIKYYRIGMKDPTIANIVGISPATLREWIVKGAYGSENELHNKLSKGTGKAVGLLEVEFTAEIRKAALGSPPEYAYDEVRFPDGRVERKISLDGEGKPIVLKAEVKPSPQWSAWFLERRFKDTWGQKSTLVEVVHTPDDIKSNTMLRNETSQESSKILVPLSKADQLEMLDIMREEILKEEKIVNADN